MICQQKFPKKVQKAQLFTPYGPLDYFLVYNRTNFLLFIRLVSRHLLYRIVFSRTDWAEVRDVTTDEIEK